MTASGRWANLGSMRTPIITCSCILLLGAPLSGCDDDTPGGPLQDGGPADAADDRNFQWPDLGDDDFLWPDQGSDSSAADLNAADAPAADKGPPDSQLDQQPSPDSSLFKPSGSCAQAPLVPPFSGKLTLGGDTSAFSDEFTGLKCNATSSGTSMSGPQAYYKISSKKDSWYKIVFTPTFTAYIYVFTSSSCTKSAIETDCNSGGATGLNSRAVAAGKAQAIYFKAPTSSGFVVGVDSIASFYSGLFKLTVEVITPPKNATCTAATTLSFQGKVASATGDTGVNLTPDEFPALSCSSSTTLNGPQVYYTFNAKSGATYVIKVTADAAQYLHPFVAKHSCVVANIAKDCSSGGTSGGYVASSNASGTTSTLTFFPPSSGLQLIGVDSEQVFNYGAFSIKVTESP